ncbi:MAG: hypothetical protein WHX93_10985 [bacterium]
MELFATDRERLAFLLETDAALDLDLEALEAQAEAPAEEPSLQQGPNTSARSRSRRIGFGSTPKTA